MKFLIDYNLNGHALVLYGVISRSGWLDLVPIEFITFADVELPSNSSDRVVWRFTQKNNMILLIYLIYKLSEFQKCDRASLILLR